MSLWVVRGEVLLLSLLLLLLDCPSLQGGLS
jgi:hypothetical protein